MSETILLLKNDFLQSWNRWIAHSRVKLGIWLIMFDLGLTLFSWRYRSPFLLHLTFAEKAIFFTVLIFFISLTNSLSHVIRDLYRNNEYEFLKFAGMDTRHFLYAFILKRLIFQTVSYLPYLAIISFGLNGWTIFYNVMGLLLIRLVVGLCVIVVTIQIATLLNHHPYWLAVVQFMAVVLALSSIVGFFLIVFKGYHGIPLTIQVLANHFIFIIGLLLLLFLYSLWILTYRMSFLENRYVFSRMNGKQKAFNVIRKKPVSFLGPNFTNIVKKDLFLNVTPAMVVRIGVLLIMVVAMFVVMDSPLKNVLPTKIAGYLHVPNVGVYVIFWGVIVTLLEPVASLYQIEGRGLGVYRQFEVDVRLIMGAKSVSSIVMLLPAYMALAFIAWGMRMPITFTASINVGLALVQSGLISAAIGTFALTTKTIKPAPNNPWMMQVPQTAFAMIAYVSAVIWVIIQSYLLLKNFAGWSDSVMLEMLMTALIILVMISESRILRRMFKQTSIHSISSRVEM